MMPDEVPRFTIVRWTGNAGDDYTHRVYTYELADFLADIESVGGTVTEHYPEGN